MSSEVSVPITIDADRLWVLRSPTTVRFSLPSVPLDGQPEPLLVHLDLDAEAVEETIARLVELRKQMEPKPT